MQEEQEDSRGHATWFSRTNFTSEILSFIIFHNTVWSQENGDLPTTKNFGPPEDSL